MKQEEAMKILKDFHDKSALFSVRTALETVLPELRESEDDRIRKGIIRNLEYLADRAEGFVKDELKERIAWLEKQEVKSSPYNDVSISHDNGVDILFDKKLVKHISGEKQGEQKKSYDTCDSSMMDNKKSPYGEKRDFGYFEEKSDDTVKPKFKVGDWVVTSYGKVNQVIAVDVDEDLDGFTLDDGTYFSGSWKDDYHLWTIKDAKDGDVLHSIGWHNDCIFIFNGLDNWKFDEPNGDRAVATGYCCLFVSADNMEFGIQGPDCIEVDNVKPASKDQRDLLFQKMHEAGYNFDFEKKELKKLKFRVGDEVITENEESLTITRIDEKGYWSNDLFICGFDDSAEWELVEQKPAEWSEEDESMYTRLLGILGKCYMGELPAKVEEELNWFKTLKERIGV